MAASFDLVQIGNFHPINLGCSPRFFPEGLFWCVMNFGIKRWNKKVNHRKTTTVCWNVKEGKANQHKRNRDILESINDLIYNCQLSCQHKLEYQRWKQATSENQLYHQILKLHVWAEACGLPCKSIPTPFLCLGQRMTEINWNQSMK